MKLKEYLYKQFGVTFFPIFLGLYFITSIIFLVRIASWTSIIQMNFMELILLYFYSIPSILFYTLPITFFISMAISLSKLSSEYELIVITSLGLKPTEILKIFAPLTLFLSITMLIVSLGLMPKSKFLTSDFYQIKKKEANFNIKASEFGQKFGDWLIYISEKKENNFSNVKLFKTDGDVEQFILSNSAKLDNEKGNLTFKLNSGKSFHLKKDELNQIDFKEMNINDSLKDTTQKKFTNAYDFWQEELKTKKQGVKFLFNILISIFPLISLFLVIAFGYINPRYEKNRAVMYSVGSIVLYYLIADILVKKFYFDALIMIPIIWISLSYFIYTVKVKKLY